MAPFVLKVRKTRKDANGMFAPIDAHMVSVVRCVLATAAFVAAGSGTYHTLLPKLLLASTALYGLYCAASCAANFRSVGRDWRAQPWIDVTAYAFFAAMTGGVTSPFFHFFFFAIATAAFSRGFGEGVCIATLAGISVLATAVLAEPALSAPQAGHVAWSLVSLLIIGYAISYWGGRELAQQARLRLLRDLAHAGNRQWSADGVITVLTQILLTFFRGDGILIVLRPGPEQPCRLYQARSGSGVGTVSGQQPNASYTDLLLEIPDGVRVSFDRQIRHPSASGMPRELQRASSEIANLLETRSFVCVPFKPSDAAVGRLYLLSNSRRFSGAEVEFLALAAGQIASAANDALLSQERAQSAGRQERAKMSRDIHDMTVQSYIGLKLGLEALYRDSGHDGPVGQRIKELLDMATLTAEDLRRYISRLHERDSQGDAELLAKLEDHRRRYETVHGIKVEMRVDRLRLGGPASGEIYHVVCEALSNIVRHTSAKSASVDLRRDGDTVAIEVANDRGSRQTSPFIPRSITERAIGLGGKVQVRLDSAGHDVIRVTIPLPLRNAGIARPA